MKVIDLYRKKEYILHMSSEESGDEEVDPELVMKELIDFMVDELDKSNSQEGDGASEVELVTMALALQAVRSCSLEGETNTKIPGPPVTMTSYTTRVWFTAFGFLLAEFIRQNGIQLMLEEREMDDEEIEGKKNLVREGMYRALAEALMGTGVDVRVIQQQQFERGLAEESDLREAGFTDEEIEELKRKRDLKKN